MIEPRYLVIMPKAEAYDSMADSSRYAADATIKEILEMMDSHNTVRYAIAEDELAYRFMYNNKDMKWISTLTMMDSLYLSNHSDIYTNYLENSKNKYRKDIIDNAAKKIKKPDVPENANNNIVYLSEVVKCIFRRIRTASSGYIEAFGTIVYFKKGSGYVRSYTPKLGDKKIYIEVELDTGLKQCYLGGSPITFDDLDKILGGVL